MYILTFIKMHEAEQANEQSLKLIEAERAQEKRITEAVATAEVGSLHASQDICLC